MQKRDAAIEDISQHIRKNILLATTKAGSGHPSSSLSATDLMAVLFFGGFFAYDWKRPANPSNDRIIFSKGHAAPLLYALYAEAGAIPEKELMTLRQFDSRLEGHPSIVFPFTEAPTGSLGQGLSIGIGMALAARLDRLRYRTFVLLGDSELAEGQVWEALQIASYYKLNNLVAICDVNRLGQRGATMYGHNTRAIAKRISAMGWDCIEIDGHNYDDIARAYRLSNVAKRPYMIIAKTIKGKGVAQLENKNGWHGKALKKDELAVALRAFHLAPYLRPTLKQPKKVLVKKLKNRAAKDPAYSLNDIVATRRAYGSGLVRVFPKFPNMVVLDAEVSNSTYAHVFAKKIPKRFFEMFIAEQNMVSVATGLARRGKLPCVSSFAAFLTRAFDQFRMANLAGAHMIIAGSHAGTSIGEDGGSQMGIEDIAMFRTLQSASVLYPSDAVSCERLLEKAAQAKGLVYIRTTRKETPILYKGSDTFRIGGSKVLRKSASDCATIVGAGITLHEALRAYELLKKDGKIVRVIDLYSIKPIDVKTLLHAVRETGILLTVEDHVAAGGIGEAVRTACGTASGAIYSLCVGKLPKSGKPEHLLAYEGIDAKTIYETIHELTHL